MSEQTEILTQMQQLVMQILKTGTATEEQGALLDELEEKMLEQKCYEETEHSEHSYKGEEIAGLFFDKKFSEAVDKMHEYAITPEDFFGFVNYHYEDEPMIDMFTASFVADVEEAFRSKSKA